LYGPIVQQAPQSTMTVHFLMRLTPLIFISNPLFSVKKSTLHIVLLRHDLEQYKLLLLQKHSTSMNSVRHLAIFLAIFFAFPAFAQQSDSTQQVSSFYGSVGLTNNGFSIIPSFSLNAPAVVTLLNWQKGRFIIAPDVRLTLDARKGGMLFWLRYQLVQSPKFSLRLGAHPAMNLQTRLVNDGDKQIEITQARRFIAGEVAPNLRITPKWSVGIYYLTGHGFQQDGPKNTHFVTLNTTLGDIKVSQNLRLMLAPAVFYLNVDGNEGTYITATAALSHKKSPFSLQSSINQTFDSNLPGNKDFLWNVVLNYNFHKDFVRRK
jgi:hypothetical protein